MNYIIFIAAPIVVVALVFGVAVGAMAVIANIEGLTQTKKRR